MKMLRSGFVVVALASASVFTATGARADGMARGPYAGSYGPFNWSGFYFGAHLGGAWSTTDFGFGSVVRGCCLEFSHDASSWIAGGQIGLQHQFGNWVAGVELSLSGVDLKESNNFTTPFGDDLRTTSEIHNLFLATARLGYAWDRWLGYVKGGYASAEVEFTTIFRPTGATINTSKDREHGWTVGTGLEYAISPNVILGVEYNFVRLNIDDRTGTDSLGCVANNCFIADIDSDIHSVMARLSFKLGRDAPTPLK
jgi:outer membrane immunogenic protein